MITIVSMAVGCSIENNQIPEVTVRSTESHETEKLSGLLKPEDAYQFSKWKSQKINWYQFDAEIYLGGLSCAAAIVIEVKEGIVVGRYAPKANEYCGIERYERYETVGEMFELIARISRDRKETVHVKYDRELGHPREILYCFEPIQTHGCEGFVLKELRPVFKDRKGAALNSSQ